MKRLLILAAAAAAAALAPASAQASSHGYLSQTRAHAGTVAKMKEACREVKDCASVAINAKCERVNGRVLMCGWSVTYAENVGTVCNGITRVELLRSGKLGYTVPTDGECYTKDAAS